MKLQLGMFLIAVLAIGVSSGYCESFDRPVEALEITSEGEYFPGFMYWYARSLFWNAYEVPEFVILGKVVEVHTPELGSEIRGTTATGRIRVNQVLRCPERLHASASRVQVLVSDALVGLESGDRVLVFMISYEGQYAIPRYIGTNCDIGFRLPKQSQPDEARLLTLLSSDRGWDPGSLTPDELRLWAELDPRSVAFWLIDALETEEKPIDQ